MKLFFPRNKPTPTKPMDKNVRMYISIIKISLKFPQSKP
jgi:hypothetical protein